MLIPIQNSKEAQTEPSHHPPFQAHWPNRKKAHFISNPISSPHLPPLPIPAATPTRRQPPPADARADGAVAAPARPPARAPRRRRASPAACARASPSPRARASPAAC